MREETIFSPQISRMRAWGLLADLNQYEAWHPHYRFGPCVIELGNKIDMTWSVMGKHASLEAKIVAHQKPDSIRWRSRPSRWCNFGCGRGPSSGGFGGDV